VRKETANACGEELPATKGKSEPRELPLRGVRKWIERQSNQRIRHFVDWSDKGIPSAKGVDRTLAMIDPN